MYMYNIHVCACVRLTDINTSGVTVGTSAAIKCLSSTREKSPV